MTVDFNADEIFEIAIRIEKNGSAFYMKASQLSKNNDTRDFLFELAKIEKSHQTTFENMKKSFQSTDERESLINTNEEFREYLVSMVDRHGGEGDPDQAELLTGKETVSDVLEIAIELEKETVSFYLFFREWLPPGHGQSKLDEIIKEEEQHIIQLTNLLN